MNTLTSLPAASSASGRFYKFYSSILTTTQRHQSTYSRTRKRLNIKPDPAFLPSKTEPHDHIVHNPPPSMPNVYHTPTVFLPKDDKRRLLQAQAPLIGNGRKAKKGEAAPAVRQPYEKRYHLVEKDFDEMRRLRSEDPWKWSVIQLSRKFDCSNVVVRLATEGIAKEKKLVQKELTEAIQSNWGSVRRIAREDRMLRRENWYKDA